MTNRTGPTLNHLRAKWRTEGSCVELSRCTTAMTIVNVAQRQLVRLVAYRMITRLRIPKRYSLCDCLESSDLGLGLKGCTYMVIEIWLFTYQTF